jgi:membrane fusion protein (multidrug efflux system)
MDVPAKLDGTAASQETPAAAAARRPGRRTVLLGTGSVLLLGAAVWGVRWWTVGRFIQSTDDAYLKADSMTVAPKVSGYVAQVLVDDNQTVTAGQELVRLDGRQYQAALEQANAAIAARNADIARGQAELALQAASIAQARAQLEGAIAAEQHAAGEVKRYQPLVASGAESNERLADLTNAHRQAAAGLAAARAALQAAERQPATVDAQLDQARAQLTAAEARAREAQLDLADTVVRSTLAGRVGDRTVRPGQLAQPGTRLMTIVPVQDIYLEANFKETQIGLMRAGQPATVSVDALPGVELHGTVVSLSPGTGSQFALLPPQNATGNFTKIVQRVPVRIHLQADDFVRPVLVPGLSVTVRVDTRSGRDAQAALAREAPRG